MPRLAPVLLCCAVLAAGCAGFTADDTETPDPVSVPEVTVPTPEATPTVTARPRIAVGVTRRQVVDPDALLTAHVGTLNEASVVFTYERAVADRNGTVRRRVVDGRAESGSPSYRATDLQVVDGEQTETGYRITDGRLERRNGRPLSGTDTGDSSQAWTVVTTDDPFGSVAATRTEDRVPAPSFRDRLEPILSTAELVRTDNPNGVPLRTTTYYYRANATTATLFGERVRNLSVLLEVEPSTVVMSYEVRYERVRTGEQVTERLRYGAVWFGSD
jgi:hypothetical protein